MWLPSHPGLTTTNPFGMWFWRVMLMVGGGVNYAIYWLYISCSNGNMQSPHHRTRCWLYQTIIPQHMPSVVWFEYVLQCYIWWIQHSWLLIVFSLTVSMLAVIFHCDFGTFWFVLWFSNTAQTQIIEHEKEQINAAKLWTGGLEDGSRACFGAGTYSYHRECIR